MLHKNANMLYKKGNMSNKKVNMLPKKCKHIVVKIRRARFDQRPMGYIIKSQANKIHLVFWQT